MSGQDWRDRLALLIAAIALGLGLVPLTITHYEPGIGLAVDHATSRLYVSSVDPFGPAAQDGVQVGLIVVRLNDSTLLRLPQPVYSQPSPDDPDQEQKILGYEPAVPTSDVSTDVLASLAANPITNLEVIHPSDLAGGSATNGYPVYGFNYPGWYRLSDAGNLILPGIAILLLGTWWLLTGRAGESLRGLAFPLVTAIATPFLVLTLPASGIPLAIAAGGLITVAAMVPLALGLADRVETPLDRRFAHAAVAVFTGAAAVIAVTYVFQPNNRDTLSDLRWGLTGAIAIVPGLIAAGPIELRAGRGLAGGAGGLLRSVELALAGATPLFALLVGTSASFWPLAVWLVGIALAGRFTVRPLARLATRATLQRDLVVAATEAERARLAADIHDDALQELTLLVRRLEASGDTEGADIGRTVADRLRAICGDLRLPILDDLGVGPALDWLVLRIERLAGGEVRLERADDARHSPDVELAIFRVAQEALANAVKHGRPPIVVRYRSTPAGISLAIDDAGPGIADQAPADAERAGRFGLLNMAQRAEQIGAILDIKRWPTGGTHVALEWRPR
jgi:signal transduction histidine kinase